MLEKKFTEIDFVKLLFWLLIKNGIYQVHEMDLKRKLYYFLENPEFKELFQDVHKSSDPSVFEADISKGLIHEKYTTGNVLWDSKHPEILYLMYPMNMDLSLYEKKLSKNGFILMKRLAYELTLQRNIEFNSEHELHLYSTNPNQFYTLPYGMLEGRNVSLELISDGDVEYKNFLSQKDLYESPFYQQKLIQDALMAEVSLKNSSYAILREIRDQQIQFANVYTHILSDYKLRKIRRYANTLYESNEHLALKGEPFVRKLELK